MNIKSNKFLLFIFFLTLVLSVLLVGLNVNKDMGVEGNDRFVYEEEFNSLLTQGDSKVDFRVFEIGLTVLYKFLIYIGISDFTSSLYITSYLVLVFFLIGLWNLRSSIAPNQYLFIVVISLAFFNYLMPSFAIRQSIAMSIFFLAQTCKTAKFKGFFTFISILFHFYTVLIWLLYLSLKSRAHFLSVFFISLFLIILLYLTGFFEVIIAEIIQLFIKFSASDVSIQDSLSQAIRATYLLPFAIHAYLKDKHLRGRVDDDIKVYIILSFFSLSLVFVPYATLRMMAYLTSMMGGIILIKSTAKTPIGGKRILISLAAVKISAAFISLI